MKTIDKFKEVWCADFEFCASDGHRPSVRCMVAHELKSGKEIRLWANELRKLEAAPFSVDGDTLFVAYYASAEFGCFLELGWPLPVNVMDLYAEFRCIRNGQPPIRGYALIGALTHFGLDSIATEEKEEMRALAMREGSPYTDAEKLALLDYCESDVLALKKLFGRMSEQLHLPQAILRGRYMKAVAKMERDGIPLDIEKLAELKRHWSAIRKALIAKVDGEYGVYDGEVFKTQKFEKFLEAKQIPWIRTDLGRLRLDDETFEEMAKTYPVLDPLRQLRNTLSGLKLNEIPVGPDGRNRCLLSVFRSITGRNQPSNSKFIFGPSSWVRHLIKPSEGFGLAYIDWSQQEIGIGAALSKDQNMMGAYRSGDFYLTFAKQAGAVPESATKKSHKDQRELFKACALAVQYGMGELSLAARINRPLLEARKLLELHHRTYPTFWRWSDAALNRAMLFGELHTTFGWKLNTPNPANDRSLRNFPVQANGAEMLRLAICLITEAGISVCAPVHDAILIEAPIGELDETVRRARVLMGTASEIVLNGFALGTDVEVVSHPGRYSPDKGAPMWGTVMSCLREIKAASSAGTP